MPFWSSVGSAVGRAVLGGAAGRAAAPFVRAAHPLAKAGGWMTKQAFKHPFMTMGAAGVGYAHLQYKTPLTPPEGLASEGWGEQIAQQGLPSTGTVWGGAGRTGRSDISEFASSVTGLVQGLHAGRRG